VTSPEFAQPIPRRGYVWWYVDGLSEDGMRAFVIIAFIGSVFSPAYALARRHGNPDPLDYCAFNVVSYGPEGRRWAFTEWGARVSRSRDALRIGPNSLAWNDEGLTIRFDELTAPFGSRLRGVVRLRPSRVHDHEHTLEHDGQHTWRPITTLARLEVKLASPPLEWRGSGYFDTNRGAVPLEETFSEWSWSRSRLRGGATVLYDLSPRKEARRELCLRFDASGHSSHVQPPPIVVLPSTGWRIRRRTRADGGRGDVVKTLEDTPFYARSIIRTRLLGDDVLTLHESLSLDRFDRRWVQRLLPFRMRRTR
jgi:carotenoid 1,2-hydratase